MMSNFGVGGRVQNELEKQSRTACNVEIYGGTHVRLSELYSKNLEIAKDGSHLP